MMWLLALLAIVVIGVAVVGAAVVIGGKKAAARVRAGYERTNQVVPGIASAAPTSWLGSHDPEAKLHRRLIDAIAALHTTQSFDTLGTYLDLRVEIEQQAVAIDNELVATSTLPVNLRDEPLARLTAAVAGIEEAVAEVGRAAASGGAEGIDRLLDRVRDRTGSGPGSLDRTQAALEELERRDPAAPPAPQDEPGTEPGSQPGQSGA